jgi:hypothetical protein
VLKFRGEIVTFVVPGGYGIRRDLASVEFGAFWPMFASLAR